MTIQDVHYLPFISNKLINENREADEEFKLYRECKKYMLDKNGIKIWFSEVFNTRLGRINGITLNPIIKEVI